MTKKKLPRDPRIDPRAGDVVEGPDYSRWYVKKRIGATVCIFDLDVSDPNDWHDHTRASRISVEDWRSYSWCDKVLIAGFRCCNKFHGPIAEPVPKV